MGDRLPRHPNPPSQTRTSLNPETRSGPADAEADVPATGCPMCMSFATAIDADLPPPLLMNLGQERCRSYHRFTRDSFSVVDPLTWVLRAVFVCLPQSTNSVSLGYKGKRRERSGPGCLAHLIIALRKDRETRTVQTDSNEKKRHTYHQ